MVTMAMGDRLEVVGDPRSVKELSTSAISSDSN